jgi:hypothetical protein
MKCWKTKRTNVLNQVDARLQYDIQMFGREDATLGELFSVGIVVKPQRGPKTDGFLPG